MAHKSVTRCNRRSDFIVDSDPVVLVVKELTHSKW